MELVTTNEDNITKLAPTKEDSTIDRLSTEQGRAIKIVSNNSSEVDEVDIVDTKSIKASKSLKCNDLVQSKEAKASFHTLEARLAFI